MATLDVNVTASIDANAKSTGGNEAADAGKLLEFNTEGQIQGSADSSSLAAVKGTASGSAYGVHGESVDGTGVVGASTNGHGVDASSINDHALLAINYDGTDAPIFVKNANVANTADLATFKRNDNLGVNIKNDGGLEWTTATGAGTTRTNLDLGALALQGDGDKGDITVSNNGATWEIDPNAVGTNEIADNAVTFAKLQDMPANHLIGRHTAGSGDPQEINIDGGLELNGSNIRRSALTGDVTASAGSNSTTIANDAVTNAKLANMAVNTIKGRITSGTGDPEDLTASQARTALGLGTAALNNTGDFEAAGAVSTHNALFTSVHGTLAAALTSDFTTNSATFVDVTGLSITLAANAVYDVLISGNLQSTNTSTAFAPSVTITGSPTQRTLHRELFSSGSSQTFNHIGVDDGGGTPITTIDAANTSRRFTLSGPVFTSGSAATIQVRIARTGAANNISVMAGTFIVARRVA